MLGGGMSYARLGSEAGGGQVSDAVEGSDAGLGPDAEGGTSDED